MVQGDPVTGAQDEYTDVDRAAGLVTASFRYIEVRSSLTTRAGGLYA